MWQFAAQQAIGEGAEHGRRQKYGQYRVAASHQDKHRAGAYARQRPAQPEDNAADQIAGDTAVLGMEGDFLPFGGFHVRPLDELDDTDAGNDG